MSGRKKREIPNEAKKLALMAAAELEKCLSPGDGSAPDAKSAKDFSAIMKAMAALANTDELSRTVKVELSPETERFAR